MHGGDGGSEVADRDTEGEGEDDNKLAHIVNYTKKRPKGRIPGTR